MQDKQRLSSYFFYGSLIFGVIGIFFSPFMASISVGFALISTLLRWNDLIRLPVYLLLWCILPLLFSCTDFFRENIENTASQKLLLNLGFAVLATSAWLNKHILREKKILIGFSSMVLIINLVSVGNYFNHKTMYDSLLAQAKSIPIFGGMHHIHFGVINALLLFFILFQVLQLSYKTPKFWWWLALYGLLLFCFHILSSRTGLLSWYITSALLTFIVSLVYKKTTYTLIGLGSLFIIGLLFISFSSSLKNKIANTKEDMATWEAENPGAINHQSMAMRIEAYKTSYEIFKNNFWTGVGAGALMPEMYASYAKNKTALTVENQKGPHNQYLESAAKYGIWGLLGSMILIGLPLYNLGKPSIFTILGVAIIVCIALANMFESLFERQASLYIIALFIPWAQHMGSTFKPQILHR